MPITLTLSRNGGPSYVHRTFHTNFDKLVVSTSTFPLRRGIHRAETIIRLTTDTRLYIRNRLNRLTSTPHCSRTTGTSVVARPASIRPFVIRANVSLLTISMNATRNVCTPNIMPTVSFRHLTRVFRYSDIPLTLRNNDNAPFSRLRLYAALKMTGVGIKTTVFRQKGSTLLRALYRSVSVRLISTLGTVRLTFRRTVAPCLRTDNSVNGT